MPVTNTWQATITEKGTNIHCFILWNIYNTCLKYCIIAIRQNTASSCVQWDRKNCSITFHLGYISQSNLRTFDPLSSIKAAKFRPLTEWYRALVSRFLIGNWRDPEGSKPRYWLNYKATSLQTKEKPLAVSRKPENIAKKEWWRQCRVGWTISRRTYLRAFAWMNPRKIITDNTQNSPQTCACTVTLSVPERRNWKDKELHEFYARYKRTSL